jgi:hypothetical protein
LREAGGRDEEERSANTNHEKKEQILTKEVKKCIITNNQ